MMWILGATGALLVLAHLLSVAVLALAAYEDFRK